MSANDQITALASQTVKRAIEGAHRLVTAESCTGGLIGGALTSVSGSSEVFDGGFITYSNEAKQGVLGVSETTLMDHGAVSEETAAAMAEGALAAAEGRADFAISVTGVAGPGGGSPEKPVGLVCFGLAKASGQTLTEAHIFDNKGRDHIRNETVLKALSLLLENMES